MNKLKKFLKENKTLVRLPVNIKFKLKSGGFRIIKAKKCTEAIEYSKVLKALRIQKELIKERIRKGELFGDAYLMGEITKEDLKDL